MNLVAIIGKKIALVDREDASSGLRAVLSHIESAIAHRDRGLNCGDESAFTDSIYRTNQAFEGGLKEAYRVITSRNPVRKSPYEIEKYLTENNLVRNRVVDLIKNYRVEWRNPSTHDYKLDFDSAEAFLAIVSVCAFTTILLDQILAKVAYDKSFRLSDEIEFQHIVGDTTDVGLTVAKLVSQFMVQYNSELDTAEVYETELIGALAGYIGAYSDDVDTVIEPAFNVNGAILRPDLLVEVREQKVLVEVKSTRSVKITASTVIDQAERYVSASGISDIVVALGTPPFNKAKVDMLSDQRDTRMFLVGPDNES